MPNGNLTREELARQLNTDYQPMVKTAIDIVASRPKWAGEVVGLLKEWLTAPKGDAIPRENLQGLLLALSKETATQDLIVQSLRNPKTPQRNRILLVETMGRANVAKLPPAWIDELGKTLDERDDALVQQAIAAMRTATWFSSTASWSASCRT